MFFYYILIAYLIPGIYVYFRIRTLIIPRGKRLIYSLVFILLLVAFPGTEWILHREFPDVFIPFARIGYYCMPFLLYLFLLVLVFDLFLLLNFIFNWIPGRLFQSKQFKKAGFFAVLIIPSLVVIYGIVNFNSIRISRYSIEIPGHASRLQNLTIAFAADFHIGDITRTGFVERFITKMNDIEPDIILFGGDMLEGDREDIRIAEIEALFRRLNAKYGNHGVYGNHEHYGRGSSGEFYKNAGIQLLQDTSFLIAQSFYLIGRKDSRDRNRLDIADLTKNIQNYYPVILLDHRPTDIEAVSQSPVDIQLSGHTHHGQLFPFNWITGKIYEISWGHEKIGNTHFFVTSGIQLWGPPVRTIGKSEIMVIHVNFTE